ncbi:hypothetical protein ABD76_14905 [Paenibacillus dendritiformis]|uniref:hypothetical protein n=1 Tax=Paenibacillus dendritiformis TaxID=130049 RepID=UPI0018CD7DA1|nr:hypothetical protein [Paenibacillus dendritiformis]MBG9793713.1 hypothetical protein [Paenibacillus dendritiformis]
MKRCMIAWLAAIVLIGAAGWVPMAHANETERAGSEAEAHKKTPAPAVNLALGKSYTLETPYPPDALFGKTESSHPDDTGRILASLFYEIRRLA